MAKVSKPSKRELAEGVAAEDKSMPAASLAGALKEGCVAALPRAARAAVWKRPRPPSRPRAPARWLVKRSTNGLVHNWRKRWCVLVDGRIFYFKSERERRPQGEPRCARATGGGPGPP